MECQKHINYLQNMAKEGDQCRPITVSTALYGCESWTLTPTADAEQRLQVLEFRCLRRILKISHAAHQTNDSVWAKITELAVPQEHLLAAVKRRKMR